MTHAYKHGSTGRPSLQPGVYSSRTADKFVVRLPDGMRERISEVSRNNHRSMNSEIIARLERTLLEDGETPTGTELDELSPPVGTETEQLADLIDRSLASRIVQLERELAEANAKLRKHQAPI